MVDEVTTEELERVDREARILFYSYIGRIMVRWQQAEDYLQDLLAALMDIDPEALKEVFANKLRLDVKIKLITAALSKCDPADQSVWADVSKKLYEMSAIRGQVAHAQMKEIGYIEVHLPSDEREGWAVQHPKEFTLHKKSIKLTADDLKEHAKGFWETWILLLNFSIAMKKKIAESKAQLATETE